MLARARRDRSLMGSRFVSLIRPFKSCRAARRPVPRIEHVTSCRVVSCRAVSCRRIASSCRIASRRAAPRRDADRAGARGGAVHEARADREDTRGDPHGRVDGRRVVMSARRATPMRCGAVRCEGGLTRCGAAWPCACACACTGQGRARWERDAGEERWDRRDAGARTSGAAPDASARAIVLRGRFVDGVGSGLVRVRPTAEGQPVK